MFARRLIPVWVGILLLSSMFLLGQESWPPASPRIQEYSNSGCLPAPMAEATDGQYPWCGDDVVEITVDDRTIHIVHRNATYNCCPDDIEVALSIHGNVLRLDEKEILTTPCDCLCCYNARSTVVDLWPGTYVVEYCWLDYEEGGEVCHREEVEVG